MAARADEPLSRSVPADVGLFVELRQADDLLLPLVEPQLWLTLAELAGQPAALKETEQWHRRVEQTVRMSPSEAIRTLFAQRVAFVAEDVRNTQDAVILCRPIGDKRQLLRRWQAQPLPTSGRAAIYRLPNHVGLALQDDLLVFGDQTTRGMFDQVVAQLEAPTAPALAADAVYQRLLASVPANPDGVAFARLRHAAPASAPTATHPVRPPLPDLPPLLRDSSNVLLALHREGSLLHISAVGDAPGTSPARETPISDLIANLPRQTLLAWAGHLDYARLAQVAAALPERSVFRLAYQVQANAGTIQRITAALNSATCVAVGTVMPENRELPAPPVPAIAVLVATRDPQSAAVEWGNMFHATVGLYRLLSLKLGSPPPLQDIDAVTIADVDAEQLDLSAVLGDHPEQSMLGELHLAWALDGDVLIVASHSDWLRQILEARHGAAPRLASIIGLSRHPAAQQPETAFIAQAGSLADLGSFWLRYFEKFAPQVLKEDWWRNYQPGGNKVRLGAQVTADNEGHRLRVKSVTPNTPAYGILKPNDEIVGCNRRRFATSQPVEEIQRGIDTRPNARWIDLMVERDRDVRVKRIALPFVDPIQILQRVTAVGRLVQRLVYLDDAPDAAGTRGYLTLELRTDQRPSFEFPSPPERLPATTAPATTTSAPTPAATATNPASRPAAPN